MPVKPTNLSIKSLKPKKEKYYEHIASHRGLAVLVRPSGVKTWVYRTRWNGKLTQWSIGQYPHITLADAIKAYSNLRSIRASGMSPSEMRGKSKKALTVEALCKMYIEMHARPNKRSWRADELMLGRYIIPAWGNDDARSKSRADMVHVVDKIIKAGHPAQVRKVISLVSKVWNFAIDRGESLINPAARMKKPVVKPRTNHLTDEQIRVLWYELEQHLRQPLAIAFKVQLLTGMRIIEVLSLTTDRIDFTNKLLIIPAAVSKNKRIHCVPVCQTAIELLKPLCRNGDFLFKAKGRETNISTTTAGHELNNAISAHGFKKFTSHDIRRTVETRFAMLKVGKEIRDRVLNHVDSSVGGKHYNQYDFLDDKRDALNLLEDHIKGILVKQP